MKLGRGTGTVRRKRWDEMFAAWVRCEHYCPGCRQIWTHKLHPTYACHLAAFAECPDELELPTGYGKSLMRVEKR